MIINLLLFIFILLLYLKFIYKKETFSDSNLFKGNKVAKNLGGTYISNCKIEKECETNICPDNMERINTGSCIKKCSDKEYRDKIDGICKLKQCSIKGKQKDSKGNCFWPPCSDLRKERDQTSGKCKWAPCDNEYRQRDKKTGECEDIPCPGPNSSEQIRNENGDC